MFAKRMSSFSPRAAWQRGGASGLGRVHGRSGGAPRRARVSPGSEKEAERRNEKENRRRGCHETKKKRRGRKHPLRGTQTEVGLGRVALHPGASRERSFTKTPHPRGSLAQQVHLTRMQCPRHPERQRGEPRGGRVQALLRDTPAPPEGPAGVQTSSTRHRHWGLGSARGDDSGLEPDQGQGFGV